MAVKRFIKWSVISLAALALTAYITLVLASVRGKDVIDLEVCMMSDPGFAGWHCKQALYLFHPTPDEVRQLNAEAGAYYAANFEGDPEEARRLLAHFVAKGVDVDSADQRFAPRWTALHKGALFVPSEQAVRLLLEAGADPNIRDAEGLTPLEAARKRQAERPYKNYSGVIKLLEAKHRPG